MKQLRLLTITFDINLPRKAISAFRGAIVAKVGRENDWFHNHNNQVQRSNNYHYRYPLIQYKRRKGKPMILCLNQGVEEIHKFFSKMDWDLTINDQVHKAKVHELNLREFEMTVSEKNYSYQIYNWIALNQKKYAEYQKCVGMTEKIAFLERQLAANIIAFAKGIDWQMEQRFEVVITDMEKPVMTTYKRTKVMTFNVKFQSNVFLPNAIGLGKGISLGFGVVMKDGR